MCIDSQNWLLSGAFMKAEYDSRGGETATTAATSGEFFVRLGIDGFDRAEAVADEHDLLDGRGS